jgi:MFS superfamily sulfate permease-like transporter
VSWPVFRSLRGYQRSWLRGDVVAGLTVWAVLVPEALAYASIAGVSPVVGLYAAPAALLLYAAFGSSRHLVTGPMSATAALSAAAVAQLATQGSGRFVQLTVALAITTGVAAVLAGLLRLGFLASFISEPVLKGFIIGLALTIVAGQLPKLFGVEGGQGDFFEKLWDLVTHLGDTHGATLALGLVSLALVLGLRRLARWCPGRWSRCCSASSWSGPWAWTTAGRHRRPHRQRPVVAGPAGGGRGRLPGPGPSAIGVMLGAGLSSGMVVNGSLSKTAVNGSAGARSQVSGLVVAALTVLTLLFLTGLFETLPEETLAAW